MVSRFIANKQAILAAAASPGPYIYSVQADRITPLNLTRKAQVPGHGHDGTG
jgi:hypothetical protein